MKKGLIWGIVILALALALIWFLPSATSNEPISEQGTSENVEELVTEESTIVGSMDDREKETSTVDTNNNMIINEVVVQYTDSGFVPAETRIAIGQTIRFVNASSRDMWPASAFHPTHTAYPGSGIEKCGTSAGVDIFDACGARDSYSFTFSDVGNWKYHNHLSANHGGTILVE